MPGQFDSGCADPACADKSDLLARALGSKPTGPCPPDREQLGRGAWALLHTTAAYFPSTPSAADRDAARALVLGLTALYPCTHCRDDFRESVAAAPVQCESREALQRWACERHNEVNAKLGKPAFSCEPSALLLRWRTGCAAKGASLSLGGDAKP